jgi:predicted nucleic acid-binding protein
MDTTKKSIFIDTNLLILTFDHTNQKKEDAINARNIINYCIKNKITMVINSLVVFELLRSVKLTPERINNIITLLNTQDYITISPISPKDALLAADLLREINLNKDIKKYYDIEPLHLNILTILGLNKNIYADNMKEDSTITFKSDDKKTIARDINTIRKINENFVIDVFHFAFCKNNEFKYKTDNTKDFENIDIAYKALVSQGKVKLKSRNIN